MQKERTIPMEWHANGHIDLCDLEVMPNYLRTHYSRTEQLPEALQSFIRAYTPFKQYLIVTLADILQALQDRQIAIMYGDSNFIRLIEESLVRSRFGSVAYF